MRVLNFVSTVATAFPLGFVSTAASADDIVDTAVSAGTFNTLVAAVQTGGKEETLRGPGPFTVFAPKDGAFAALPEGTVEGLLLPENRDQLVAILTYHVVPGEVMSTDAAGAVVDLTTVQGSDITVDGSGDGDTVNGANGVAADIEAENGVIHVFDAVIMPGS